MSSVVVHNDMHLESGRNLVLDDIEELREFQGAIPALVNVFIKLDILTIDGIYFQQIRQIPCLESAQVRETKMERMFTRFNYSSELEGPEAAQRIQTPSSPKSWQNLWSVPVL